MSISNIEQRKTLKLEFCYTDLMGTDEEVILLKKQLRKLELKLDVLKDFTIDEIAKTRVGILKENNRTDKENKDKGMVY